MKIAALVSGGVDSSVALRLLKAAGHDVQAFYLKIWLEDRMAFMGECPWEEDLGYLRQICGEIGVPLEIIPLQNEYHQKVVHYAIEALRAGLTPSPDLMCNLRIKFGDFDDLVGNQFERIASGHYARTRHSPEGCQLLTSPDPVKDQTYFLARMNQKQVSRALFPLGEMNKSQVRNLAAEMKLPNFERRDSQGICFLGRIRFRDFVEFNLGKRPGQIVERETGRVLGRHEGYWFHTLGQRQGLGLSGGPWYVVGKNTDENTVLVTHADNLTRHAVDCFEISSLNWISGQAPAQNKLEVKIRHAAHRFGCHLTRQENDRFQVRLNQSDPGIAPGQFAVLYDGEVCLGSGVIS